MPKPTKSRDEELFAKAIQRHTAGHDVRTELSELLGSNVPAVRASAKRALNQLRHSDDVLKQMRSGDYERARTIALRLAKSELPRVAAIAKLRLGTIHSRRSRLFAAARSYEDGLSAARAHAMQDLEADALLALGINAYLRGARDEGRKCVADAVNLLERTKGDPKRARFLYTYADLLDPIHDYELAKAKFRQAMQLSAGRKRTSTDDINWTFAVLGLAKLELAQDHLPAAEKLLRGVLNSDRVLSNAAETTTRQALAIACLHQLKLEEARTEFSHSLRGAMREGNEFAAGSIETGLGWVELLSQWPEAAMHHFELASERFDARAGSGHSVESEFIAMGVYELFVGQSLAMSGKARFCTGPEEARRCARQAGAFAKEARFMERKKGFAAPLLSQVYQRVAVLRAVEAIEGTPQDVARAAEGVVAVTTEHLDSPARAVALLERARCTTSYDPERHVSAQSDLQEARDKFQRRGLPNWISAVEAARELPPGSGWQVRHSDAEEAINTGRVRWDVTTGELFWYGESYLVPPRGRPSFDLLFRAWRFGRSRRVTGEAVRQVAPPPYRNAGIADLFRHDKNVKTPKPSVWLKVVVRDGPSHYFLKSK